VGEVKIKDTGKYSVGASVVDGEKRAAGDDGVAGTELTLNGVQVSLNQNVMTSDDSIVNKKKSNTSTEAYDFGEADTSGINIPVWSVQGHILRTNETEMKALGRLLYMCRTKGYKELYSSTGNGFYDIIVYSKYGEREAASESTKTVTYINVRIKSLSITQTADRKGFRYTLNLVETN
jgi:hypothetical protein